MPNVVLHFQDIAIINAEQQIAQMSMHVRECVGVCVHLWGTNGQSGVKALSLGAFECSIYYGIYVGRKSTVQMDRN